MAGSTKTVPSRRPSRVRASACSRNGRPRAGVSFAEWRYEVAGFIRNAFDEDYLLDAGNTGGAFTIPTFIPAEPRFYGLEVTAKF